MVAARGRDNPGAGAGSLNSRLNAPRGLKLPACCKSSSFSATGSSGRSVMARSLPVDAQDRRVTDMRGYAGGGDCIWRDRSIMGMRRLHALPGFDKLKQSTALRDQSSHMSHRRMHGSCVSRNGEAVLLIGPSGSGKSDLVLRLLARGFELVADDQVEIRNGFASCPISWPGCWRCGACGIVRLPHRPRTHLALVVGPWCERGDRLPQPDGPSRAWVCRDPHRRLRRLGAGAGGAGTGLRAWAGRAGRRVLRRMSGSAVPRTAVWLGKPSPLSVVLVSGLRAAARRRSCARWRISATRQSTTRRWRCSTIWSLHGEGRLAIGIDARTRGFNAACGARHHPAARASRPAGGPGLCLGQRTRPAAPLYRNTPAPSAGAAGAGAGRRSCAEQVLTAELREHADLVVDTSDLPLAGLRRLIEQHFGEAVDRDQARMVVSLVSFAYSRGLPPEADLVFDARFLRNPHYDPMLRPRTGWTLPLPPMSKRIPTSRNFLPALVEDRRHRLAAIRARRKKIRYDHDRVYRRTTSFRASD